MDLPLSGSSPFIDAEAEPVWIQNFYHIWRVGLYPEFFSMSDQPGIIWSCHMISSIMKSRFGSLISQLSSPVSKKGLRNVKRHYDQTLQITSDASNFPIQGLVSLLRSFSLKPAEWERGGGICSGQFLTCTRIKTCVPYRQNLPRIPTIKANRASPWRALFG